MLWTADAIEGHRLLGHNAVSKSPQQPALHGIFFGSDSAQQHATSMTGQARFWHTVSSYVHCCRVWHDSSILLGQGALSCM